MFGLLFYDSIWSNLAQNSSSYELNPLQPYCHYGDDLHGSIISPSECVVYVFGGTTRSVELNRLMWINYSEYTLLIWAWKVQQSSEMGHVYRRHNQHPLALGQRASHSAVTHKHNMYILVVYLGSWKASLCTMICGAIPLALGHGYRRSLNLIAPDAFREV